MSTRHLLNMTMGSFAMLLLAAIGIVFSTTGNQNDQNTQIDLAVRQQVLVQDLTRQAAALSDAEDRDAVVLARKNLGLTIVQFDRNLTALLHGGPAVDANGQTVVINRTRNDMARIALEDGAHLWLETGMPLADLSAGEFSIFSAAGQKAVKNLQNNNVELMQHMGTAANSLRMGIHARGTVAGIARWAAAGLAAVLIGLGVFRRKLLAAEPAAPAPGQYPVSAAAPVYAESPVQVPPPLTHRPAGLPSAPPDQASFVSPVNFDSVNASVDQMSVDMNTIAGSTEKMRLAIDSVGNALQGMLYSLNEMAQDTAEGHKIVRNANNAASFTADTAGDLAASAREMAEVVSRVTQLAQKTKQVASQIDEEAVYTGKTGEAFTSVVAGEVKGLAHQTGHATQEIEQTVAEILLTARQYEEAIGQIIKNVSAINKVSQNLGELMLSSPAHVQPGPPLPASQPLVPAPGAAAPAAPVPETAPAPVAEAPVAETPVVEAPAPPPAPVVEDDPVTPEATPEEVAAQTTAAIDEVVETAESDGAQDESSSNVFMLGGRAKKPNALNIPEVPAEEPVAEEAAPVEAEIAPVETPTTPVAEDPAPAAEAEVQPSSGSNGNVFMLGRPKKKAPAEAPATEATPPADPQPEAAPAAEPAEADGNGKNVFMLNKPKAAPEAEATPAAEAAPEAEAALEAPAVSESEPTPEPEPAPPAAAEPAAAEPEPAAAPPAPAFEGPNIYGLELPEAAPAAAAAPVTATAANEPETVPPSGGGEGNDGGSNANIFMLNKPS